MASARLRPKRAAAGRCIIRGCACSCCAPTYFGRSPTLGESPRCVRSGRLPVSPKCWRRATRSSARARSARDHPADVAGTAGHRHRRGTALPRLVTDRLNLGRIGRFGLGALDGHAPRRSMHHGIDREASVCGSGSLLRLRSRRGCVVAELRSSPRLYHSPSTRQSAQETTLCALGDGRLMIPGIHSIRRANRGETTDEPE